MLFPSLVINVELFLTKNWLGVNGGDGEVLDICASAKWSMECAAMDSEGIDMIERVLVLSEMLGVAVFMRVVEFNF